MNQTKRSALIELESYWNNRLSELVESDQLDDADALYSEFIVEDKEQPFMFLEYLNDI
tara:strand:- start:53 stop:226 length:174 start_codon:yes stop_codon:yes gene_type:complete